MYICVHIHIYMYVYVCIVFSNCIFACIYMHFGCIRYLRCDCCRGDDEHDTTKQNMFHLDTLKKTLTKHKDSAWTSAL